MIASSRIALAAAVAIAGSMASLSSCGFDSYRAEEDIVTESFSESCDRQYASQRGYTLCEASADFCTFSAEKRGQSCHQVCESHGGLCVEAYGNGTDLCEAHGPIGCDADDKTADICVCTRGRDDTAASSAQVAL